MNDKNSGGFDNEYPDLSGLFDIDESKIPEKAVPPDKDKGKTFSERILTSPEGSRFLSPEDRKKQKAFEKREKRELLIKRLHLKTIFILAGIIILIAIAGIIKYLADDAKKPEIRTAKAEITTVERTHSDRAFIIKNASGATAVLIDKDYDVHFIEKELSARLISEDGTVVTGIVSDIREEKTDSALFERITSFLLGSTPEIAVYAVYIRVTGDIQALSDGQSVRAEIITKSSPNAIAVPTSAVYTAENQCYVWIYHPLRRILTRQDVATGISGGGMTEIIKGLSKGSTVVTYASLMPQELYDGIKVKPEQEKR